MILRKPYAFLIKHFRIIHVLLSIILGVILYQTNINYNFFKQYIRDTNYLNLYIEPEITSVGIFIFVMIFLALALFIAIFVLMNRKKKPIKFYFISIAYYSIFIIFLFVANSQLYNILLNRATLTTITMIKDLFNMFYITQYIFIFICVIRAIGFNIKKFDFKSDLRELEILESDNEEFEFEVSVDTDDVKMKARRAFRIFKYLLQENKKLLIYLSSITVVIIIVNVFLNIFVYNRIYKEGESFDVGSLTYEVLDSYETTKDYSLKTISNKKIYYITKLKVKNNDSKKRVLNLEHITLRTDKMITYEPNIKVYSNFIDLGQGYKKQQIQPNEEKIYILVFEVNKEEKDNDKILQILRGYVVEDGETIYKYSKVGIKPTNLDEIEEQETAKLTETLSMKDNVLGEINVNIESYEITDKIEHSYEESINNKEYSFIDVIQPSFDDYYGKKLMNLRLSLEPKNVSNDKAIIDFLGKYAEIRYVKNKKEYVSLFRGADLTPDDVITNVYLEVPEEVDGASNIYLDIIIRNKKYTYVLK